MSAAAAEHPTARPEWWIPDDHVFSRAQPDDRRGTKEVWIAAVPASLAAREPASPPVLMEGSVERGARAHRQVGGVDVDVDGGQQTSLNLRRGL